MASTKQHGDPFEVGDAVIHDGRETVVAKVLKSGNFKIEGADQQYRPSGYPTGTSWTRKSVVHANAEALERLATERARLLLGNALYDAHRWSGYIDRMSRAEAESLLPLAVQIVAALKPKP